MYVYAYIKLIAFELAAKFSRRRENPFNHVCATRKTQFSNGSKRGFPFGRDLRRPTQTQSALHRMHCFTPGWNHLHTYIHYHIRSVEGLCKLKITWNAYLHTYIHTYMITYVVRSVCASSR
jgi:hypothetical protein